jgi:hypothetical protein
MEYYQSAANCGTKVYRYPKPGVDIVQVKISEDKKRKAKNNIYYTNHNEQLGLTN